MHFRRIVFTKTFLNEGLNGTSWFAHCDKKRRTFKVSLSLSLFLPSLLNNFSALPAGKQQSAMLRDFRAIIPRKLWELRGRKAQNAFRAPALWPDPTTFGVYCVRYTNGFFPDVGKYRNSFSILVRQKHGLWNSIFPFSRQGLRLSRPTQQRHHALNWKVLLPWRRSEQFKRIQIILLILFFCVNSF